MARQRVRQRWESEPQQPMARITTLGAGTILTRLAISET